MRSRPSNKVGCSPARREKAESHKRQKNLEEVLPQREVVKIGVEVGERKRSSSTATATCARGVLWRLCMLAGLAVFRNVGVLSLPVLTSDRHALRHLVDCRFSARGNLHRDLELAARCSAVLARAQP
eukprot:6192110-Pleurochrysis_carterae.AAC.1